MLQDGKVFVGRSIKPEILDLKLANRHGLITGATGTGKTVTLQVIAEGLSEAGVSVFAADIKGDLSGISCVGANSDAVKKRAVDVGLQGYENKAFPTIFWDVFGQMGHPIRATIEDMGPLLLSRLLELNEVQEGVLNIAFRVAKDENKPIVSLKDLRAAIGDASDRSAELRAKYGNVASTSVGSIQRRLLVLEEQGAAQFFGEPALNILDFIRQAPDGRGIVNILAADKLMEKPQLYATFLLWMLTKLWQTLPEVGDLPKPKLCFFFDEAHLLFTDAPKPLLQRIEQIARLIRSKGVGVYFITQNPLDVPDTVAAQLGNRVQHALRAFTPAEQKAVKAAASTFRPNPQLDTERAIMELKLGEALVSMLENRGEPSMVQRTEIAPPQGRMGPVSEEERQGVIQYSPYYNKYETRVERAGYDAILNKGAQAGAAPDANGNAPATGSGWLDRLNPFGRVQGAIGRSRQGMGTMIGKELERSVARSAATILKDVVLKALGMRR